MLLSVRFIIDTTASALFDQKIGEVSNDKVPTNLLLQLVEWRLRHAWYVVP